MTMTINLTAGDRVGPGYGITVSNILSSPPNDIIFCQIQRVPGVGIMSAYRVLDGATSTQMVFAIPAPGVFGYSPMLDYTIVPGDTVQLDVWHGTATPTLIENAVFTGMVWDPVQGLAGLLVGLFSVGQGGLLQSIYESVHREYP